MRSDGHLPQWYNSLVAVLNVKFADEVKAMEIVAGRISGALGPDLGYEYAGDGIMYAVIRGLVLQSVLKIRDSCGDFDPVAISTRLATNNYFRLLMADRLGVSTRSGANFNLANGFERLVALLFLESGSLDSVLKTVGPLIQPDIDAYLAAKDRAAFLEGLRKSAEVASAHEHDAVTTSPPPLRPDATPGESTLGARVNDRTRQPKLKRKRRRKRGRNKKLG